MPAVCSFALSFHSHVRCHRIAALHAVHLFGLEVAVVEGIMNAHLSSRPRKGRSPGRRTKSLRDEAGRTAATAGTTSEFDVAEETNCHGRSFIFPSILKTETET